MLAKISSFSIYIAFKIKPLSGHDVHPHTHPWSGASHREGLQGWCIPPGQKLREWAVISRDLGNPDITPDFIAKDGRGCNLSKARTFIVSLWILVRAPELSWPRVSVVILVIASLCFLPLASLVFELLSTLTLTLSLFVYFGFDLFWRSAFFS